MKLSIRMNDGTLVADFDIAFEFGDIRRNLPKAVMTNLIVEAIERNQEALNELDREVKANEESGF